MNAMKMTRTLVLLIAEDAEHVGTAAQPDGAHTTMGAQAQLRQNAAKLAAAQAKIAAAKHQESSLAAAVGALDAKLGVMAFRGDADSTGDALLCNSHALFDKNNPADDFFNGTRSNNGLAVSTSGDLPQLAGTAGSMTGMSEEQYRDMMIAGGRSVEGNRVVGEDGDAQANHQPQGQSKQKASA